MAESRRASRTKIEPLRPAAEAFDAVAPFFDQRFGSWLSVAAQRRAVRAALLREFPVGGSILELGAGTGEDAAFLAERGFNMFITDPSPAMVSMACAKLAPFHARAEIVAGEDFDNFASHYLSSGGELFDGAFSNFAPLNCVEDLEQAARGLARLLKPGAAAMLVLFGTFCPGEIVMELIRRRPKAALRRCWHGRQPARLVRREFQVVYHRQSSLQSAFAPWFVLEKRLGVGVAVPPSAAEPWISAHRRLLAFLEAIDQVVSLPMAFLGDHVLYQLRRTDVSVS